MMLDVQKMTTVLLSMLLLYYLIKFFVVIDDKNEYGSIPREIQFFWSEKMFCVFKFKG